MSPAPRRKCALACARHDQGERVPPCQTQQRMRTISCGVASTANSNNVSRGNNVFASVRAGDVNGYDSLPLSTTVVRGEGREPRRSLLRSRSESIGGLTNISFVGYIELPTEPRSHVTTWFSNYAVQWVVLYDQQILPILMRLELPLPVNTAAILHSALL